MLEIQKNASLIIFANKFTKYSEKINIILCIYVHILYSERKDELLVQKFHAYIFKNLKKKLNLHKDSTTVNILIECS